MFRNLFAKMGIGAAKVDTRLQNSIVKPGDYLQGVTHIKGGDVAQEIDSIFLHFMTSAKYESDGNTHYTNIPFYKAKITDQFHIQIGEEKQIPFNIQTPFEMPLTVLNGSSLMSRGGIYIVTDMDIENALDASDKDKLEVEPNPVMASLLYAVQELGFQFYKADVEKGHIQGSVMPFFQEFEYKAYRTPYGSRINELELSFIGRPHECEVVLEMDKRGGFFSAGRDSYRRFIVPYNNYQTMDMKRLLDDAIRSMV